VNIKRLLFGALAVVGMIGGVVTAITDPPVKFNGGTLGSFLLCAAVVIMGVVGTIKSFCDSADEGFGVSDGDDFLPKSDYDSLRAKGFPYDDGIKSRGDNFIVYK